MRKGVFEGMRIVPQHEGDQLLEADRRAAAEMRRLSMEADAYLDRAKWIRVRAGRARFALNRWIMMGMAHHLERKGGACLRDLVALRKVHKLADRAETGHRSARRRLDREAS